MNVVERMRRDLVTLAGKPPGEALDRLLERRAEWVELIKVVRQLYGIGAFAAEQMVLAHPGWRRWCQGRINREPVCRKAAFRHLRFHGADGLIAREGDRYVIVAPL